MGKRRERKHREAIMTALMKAAQDARVYGEDKAASLLDEAALIVESVNSSAGTR